MFPQSYSEQSNLYCSHSLVGKVSFKLLFLSMKIDVFFFLRAMSSAANKEQFLKQFEQIVEGIKNNKAKVLYDILTS